MGTNTLASNRTPVPRNADVAAVMDGVRQIVRALRVSTRSVERQIGISGAQLFVLQQLAEHPAQSVNELAERTLTHQSSVSVVVTRLVEQGLAVRTTSREDARRAAIDLTPKGRKLLADAPVTTQAQLVGALRRLPPEQVAVLASALGAWITEAGIGQEPAQLFFEEDPASEGENG